MRTLQRHKGAELLETISRHMTPKDAEIHLFHRLERREWATRADNYGVSVVASGAGGIPDFVNDRNGFLFGHKSQKGVAAAIDYLNDLDPILARIQGASIARLTDADVHQLQVRQFYSDITGSSGDIDVKH